MVHLDKQFVPLEDSTPQDAPLFMNHSQALAQGGDVYLDVGIVPVDDVLSREDQPQFLVLQRLVMSPWTLVALKHQVDTICRQIQEQGVNVAEIYSQIESLTAQAGIPQKAKARRARKVAPKGTDG